VTASCGIEPTRLVYYKPILDEAIRLSSYKPSTCIVYQRDQVIVNQIGLFLPLIPVETSCLKICISFPFFL